MLPSMSAEAVTVFSFECSSAIGLSQKMVCCQCPLHLGIHKCFIIVWLIIHSNIAFATTWIYCVQEGHEVVSFLFEKQ